MGNYAQKSIFKHNYALRIPTAYWFVLPAMLFFTVLAIYPSGYTVFLSLFAGPKGTAISQEFTNFSNYTAVFNSPKLVQILLQTGYYAGVATLLHLLLGFLTALLLNVLPLNIQFIRFARTAFLIPWAISPTVVAILFRLLLHPQVGPFAIILKQMGYTGVFFPLGNPDMALMAVTLTNVWTFTPFYFLMLLSAMQSIDPTLYEAAVVDGANGRQQIFHITLPMIKNTLLTLAIFDFVTTAAYFDLTWILTQGGPINKSEILSTWVYRTAFQSFEFGKASAIGMILFAVSIIFTVIVLRAIDKG
ncbi:MAG: sugar ABC transporter permease [Chloroflexi bacterium]|nr:sugar ABC transporter permease [Chloroflexota bacterium]